MDYRKLIKFGNSSYVVSVPKTWVERNKLVKGDSVVVHENGGNELIIKSPVSDEQRVKIREKTIVVNTDNLTRIKREITSAYLDSYHSMVITGEKLEPHVREIRDFLSGFMALEVVEQDKTKIIARDFLNMKKISLKTIIRKIDLLVRGMLEDSQKMTEYDAYQSIVVRDDDVNKMVNVLMRVGRYALQKPHLANQAGLDLYEVYTCLHRADALEKIADETKRIARIIKSWKAEKVTKKKFSEVYREVGAFYGNVMDYSMGGDEKKKGDLMALDKSIMKKCDILAKKMATPEMACLSEKMKAMTSYIQSMLWGAQQTI